MDTKTLCLVYASMLEDILNGIPPKGELLNEIITFLKTLLGIEFTEEQLNDPIINNQIVACIKAIQTQINETRKNLTN